MKRTLFRIVVGCLVLLMHAHAWASHPLITDDAGTQGKGKYQLEVNGQYDSDKDTSTGTAVHARGGEAAIALSFGIADTTDLVLNQPYQWNKVSGSEKTEKGIADTVFEVKWRFIEKDGYSLAVKPGISFASGDEDKGMGTGKTGYHLFLIGSKEMAPLAFHANLGYIRNENKADENVDIWHVSLAATYEIMKDLKIVGNIGMEKNPDTAADNDPAFLIGGLIYSINENCDVDFGVKGGLTSSETDLSLMVGTSIRF